MRAPSPNDYTQNPSPQPNGETIPKQLHSPPPSADRWKRLPQIPTLSHPHRSQTAEPSQNGHAQRVTNPANPQQTTKGPLLCNNTQERPSIEPNRVATAGCSTAAASAQLKPAQLKPTQANSAQAKFSSAGISSPCQRPEPEQLPAVPACWPQRLQW